MKSAYNDYIDYIPCQVIELYCHFPFLSMDRWTCFGTHKGFCLQSCGAQQEQLRQKTKPWKKGILSHALNGSFNTIKFGENWVLALARSLSSPQPAIGPDFVAVSWSYFAGTCERHWLEQWKLWNCSLRHMFGYEDACGPLNLLRFCGKNGFRAHFDPFWSVKQMRQHGSSSLWCSCHDATLYTYNIHNTRQYHTIQYNTMQYNTMQSNSKTVQYSSIVQYNAIQCNAVITLQCSVVKYPSPQCRKGCDNTHYTTSTLYSAILPYATLHWNWGHMKDVVMLQSVYILGWIMLPFALFGESMIFVGLKVWLCPSKEHCRTTCDADFHATSSLCPVAGLLGGAIVFVGILL